MQTRVFVGVAALLAILWGLQSSDRQIQISKNFDPPPASQYIKAPSPSRRSVVPTQIPFGKEFWRAPSGDKIDAAVERVTHAFNESRVRSGNYQIELIENGFSFTPAGANVAARFRVGGDSWQTVGNTAQAIGADGFVRHIETLESGAFLTWIIPSRPQGNSLEFAVEVSGVSYVGKTDHGHHFADDEGVARVRFGNATAVDSTGSKWPINVAENVGKLVVKVSAEVLANAVYPLAIDPEITAEEGIDVLEPAPSNPSVQNPSIASNGDIFLVAWEQRAASQVYEIRGTRLTRDGVIVDPSGLKFSWNSPQASHCITPGVGSDGTNFLVAWMELSPSNGVSAAIIGANGSIMARSKLSSFAPYEYRAPAIASDGTSYFVAWQNGYVRGRIVPNNTLSSSSSVLTISDDSSFGPIGAVWNGTSYSVAWQGNASFFRRVNRDGTFVESTPRAIGVGTDPQSYNLAFAWNGQSHFLAWNGTYALLDAQGTVLQTAAAPGKIQSALWDGSAFWTIWQDDKVATVNRLSGDGQWLDGAGVRVLRPAPSLIAPNSVRLGRVADSIAVSYGDYYSKGAYAGIIENPPVDIGTGLARGNLLSAPGGDHAPAAAPLGEGHLVVWSGATNPNNTHADIIGARIGADGTLLDPTGFVINGEFRDQMAPAVASLGHETLVVWEDWNSTNPNIRGTRVSADGSLIGGVVTFAGAGYPETAPSVAAAGDRYLVVWDARPAAGQFAIRSKIYAPNQAQQWNAVDVLPARSRPFDYLPKAASDGTNFLVAWHAPYAGAGSIASSEGPLEYAKAYAARVDAEGAVLDPNGFAITSPTTADQLYPVVAFGGGNYLAAWMQIANPTALNIELWCAPIFSNGQRGAPKRIATGDKTRWSLNLAGNAAGFFASWRDKSTNLAENPEIKGAYLRADGSLSDEGNFLINGGQFTWNPAISVSKGDDMLIASEASRPGAFRTVWNRTSGLEPPMTGIDAITHGNWKARFGAAGYMIAADAAAIPAGVQVSFANASLWKWTQNTTATAALERPTQPGRIAACWVSGSSFDVRLTFGGTDPHPVAFYLLDWDSIDRAEVIEISDFASGKLLHSVTVDNFHEGKYLIYELSGDVRVRFTKLRGNNAVLSGIFFPSTDVPMQQAAPPSIQPNGGTFTNSTTVSLQTATTGASIYYTLDGSEPTAASQLYTGPIQITSSVILKASAIKPGLANSPVSGVAFTRADTDGGLVRFLGRDDSSLGNWIGNYGAEGYLIFRDSQRAPTNGAFAVRAGALWPWSDNTSDTRALQRATAPASRVAACIYSAQYVEAQVDLPPGERHQLAIYCVDWEHNGRGQIAEIWQSGVLLSSESLTNFQQGAYLVWEVTGPVTVRLCKVSGINAVISGIFIDPPAAPAPPSNATFVGVDDATQGDWQNVYGAKGFQVIADWNALPADVTIQPSGHFEHIWEYDSTNKPALQKFSSPSRIAACWYSSDTITLDVNAGEPRNLTLYFLDWDNAGRAQTLTISDPNTGDIVDQRMITNFITGRYVTWQIRAPLRIEISRQAGPNAVVSGIFID
jgi:hypothetical protein